jgi:hypothetical protein
VRPDLELIIRIQVFQKDITGVCVASSSKQISSVILLHCHTTYQLHDNRPDHSQHLPPFTPYAAASTVVTAL